MNTESHISRSAQPDQASSSPTPLGSPEIAEISRENSPILIQKLFGGLREGYTLLDIAESTANISKLRDLWSKKKGRIIGIRIDSDIGRFLQSIDTQEPVDAVSMLGQLHQIARKEEKVAVLAAIKSKLNPGGTLLVTVPVSSSMGELDAPNEREAYETMVIESGLTVIGNVLINTADTKIPNDILEIIAQKPAVA